MMNNLTNPIIDANGNKFWRNESGQLHRDNNLPAIEQANGTNSWWINGNLQQILYNNGTEEWYDENEDCLRRDEWIDNL